MSIRSSLRNLRIYGIPDNIIYNGISATIITVGAAVCGLQCYAIERASHLNPPVYKDVNSDGIKDKIIQKRVDHPGFLISTPEVEEEILYGININGKTIYLPKEQFDGLKD